MRVFAVTAVSAWLHVQVIAEWWLKLKFQLVKRFPDLFLPKIFFILTTRKLTLTRFIETDVWWRGIFWWILIANTYFRSNCKYFYTLCRMFTVDWNFPKNLSTVGNVLLSSTFCPFLSIVPRFYRRCSLDHEIFRFSDKSSRRRITPRDHRFVTLQIGNRFIMCTPCIYTVSFVESDEFFFKY